MPKIIAVGALTIFFPVAGRCNDGKYYYFVSIVEKKADAMQSLGYRVYR